MHLNLKLLLISVLMGTVMHAINDARVSKEKKSDFIVSTSVTKITKNLCSGGFFSSAKFLLFS